MNESVRRIKGAHFQSIAKRAAKKHGESFSGLYRIYTVVETTWSFVLGTCLNGTVATRKH